MDSNAARFSREDDKECQNVPPPGAEEPSRPQGSGPQAAGEAGGGCHCDTHPLSSPPIRMEGYPDYFISGGVDWFEWSAIVRWNGETFKAFVDQFSQSKEFCQREGRRFLEVHVPDFGPVRVSRVGVNRGGERGQHFEFKLSIAGVVFGLSARYTPVRSQRTKRHRPAPNFYVKQTGRGCLLVGPLQAYEMAEAFVSALGGEFAEQIFSRGDLCLDIAHLDPEILHKLASDRHIVTRADNVRPEINYVTGLTTGFHAGKSPCYLTIYNKYMERLGKSDSLYLQALIDRRWYGSIPMAATRIEFQLCRNWLTEKGISTPQDFLERRGTLCDYLTKDWFRLTERAVDRRRKHQSRAKTHPLWIGIQKGFNTVFGPPEGILAPIDRAKVEPIALAAQGRGCFAACLQQMGIDVQNYLEFVNKAGSLLLTMFPGDEERQNFMREMERRKMEFETS